MLGKRLLQSLPKTINLTQNPQIKQLKRPMPGALIDKNSIWVFVVGARASVRLDVMTSAVDCMTLLAQPQHAADR